MWRVHRPCDRRSTMMRPAPRFPLSAEARLPATHERHRRACGRLDVRRARETRTRVPPAFRNRSRRRRPADRPETPRVASRCSIIQRNALRGAGSVSVRLTPEQVEVHARAADDPPRTARRDGDPAVSDEWRRARAMSPVREDRSEDGGLRSPSKFPSPDSRKPVQNGASALSYTRRRRPSSSSTRPSSRSLTRCARTVSSATGSRAGVEIGVHRCGDRRHRAGPAL